MDPFDISQLEAQMAASLASLQQQQQQISDPMHTSQNTNKFEVACKTATQEVESHLASMEAKLTAECSTASTSEKRSLWSKVRKDYAIWLEDFVQRVFSSTFGSSDDFGVIGDEKALELIDFVKEDIVNVASNVKMLCYRKILTPGISSKESQKPLTESKVTKIGKKCDAFYVMYRNYWVCMTSLTPDSSDERKQEVLDDCLHVINEQIIAPTAHTVKVLRSLLESHVMGKAPSKPRRAAAAVSRAKKQEDDSSSSMISISRVKAQIAPSATPLVPLASTNNKDDSKDKASVEAVSAAKPKVKSLPKAPKAKSQPKKKKAAAPPPSSSSEESSSSSSQDESSSDSDSESSQEPSSKRKRKAVPGSTKSQPKKKARKA